MKLRTVHLMFILFLGGFTKLYAHESKVYTVEDAELFGVCESISSLIKAGLPANSQYIQDIINYQNERFSSKDVKEALTQCIQVSKRKQEHAYENINSAIEDVLSKK